MKATYVKERLIIGIIIVVIAAIVGFFGCTNKPNKKGTEVSVKKSKWDEWMIILDTSSNKDMYLFKRDHFDTTHISESPIEILSIDTSHTNIIFSDIKDDDVLIIHFKNISNKTIEGVKMRWYCEDAFRDPCFLSPSYGIGFEIGEGQSDDHILPGKTGKVKWVGFFSKMNVVKAWPYQVAFSDGSTWSVLK